MDLCSDSRWAQEFSSRASTVTGRPLTELAIPLATQMEVYNGKLFGILQAAERFRPFFAPQKHKKSWMFNDSQAAVQRLTAFQTAQGQDGTRNNRHPS
jgi:hypothetical protein